MRIDDLYALYVKPTGGVGRWSRRGGYFTQAAAELETKRFPAMDCCIIHERNEVVFSTVKPEKPADTRPATGIP